MRRLHLIPRPQDFDHVTHDDDPDVTPKCPCDPSIEPCDGVLIVRHREVP